MNKSPKNNNKSFKFNKNSKKCNKQALVSKNNFKNTKVFKKAVWKKFKYLEPNKNKSRIFMILQISCQNKMKN